MKLLNVVQKRSNNMSNYDLSDLGEQYSDKSHDLSSLGGETIIQDESSSKELLNNIYSSQPEEQKTKMVDTFLGQMPDVRDENTRKELFNPPLQEQMQKAASIALPFLAPEIRAVPYISPLLSKIPGATAIGNMLGRIGYGTALTTLPETFNKEDRNNLGENIKTNALLNTGLEAFTMPFRGLNAMTELFNPIKYSRMKAAAIKKEHDAAKSVMEENYSPIKNAYGDFTVSVTPKKYLEESGINKKHLYPDAKEYYEEFVNEPNYNNLINLKSQVGRDWAKISTTDKVRDAQLFNRYRNTLDSKVKNFLSRDPELLQSYENANRYAENVYYPYLSTPTLKTIAKGKYQNIYPDKMAKSLEKATEGVVGAEHKYKIPENHPLRNHLKELQNRISIGDISELATPALAGALLGGLSGNSLIPSYGSYAGGLGGLGAGLALGLGGSKLLKYPVIQSPTVQNAFSKINPFFYKTGRAAINTAREKE